MQTITAILCITAICLGSRLPFAFFNSTDRWLTSLLLTTNSSKRWIDLELPRAVQGKAVMPYPPLVHFLSSRLPRKYWKVGAFLISYLSDAVVAFLLYLGLVAALAGQGFESGQAHVQALIASISFLCLPILLPLTARVKAPNGRALGMLVTTFYFACLWLALHASAWFLLAACLFALLAVLASKFAMQVVFFFSPLLAIFLWSPALIVPPGAILLIVLARPRSIFATLCVDKIVHALRYKIVGSTAENRNLFPNFYKYFSCLFSDYANSARMLRRWSPLLIALVSIPYAFVVLAAPLSPSLREAIFSDSVLTFAYWLIVSATLVFLLTSVGFFRVFGESERYYEYASPFVVFLLMAVLAKAKFLSPGFGLFMLGFNVALVLFLHLSTDFRLLARISRFNFNDDPELRQVHAYLSGLDKAAVGAVPIKLTFMLMNMAAEDNLHGITYYHPTIATVPVRISDYKFKKEAFATPFIFANDPQWVETVLGIDTWVEEIPFSAQNPDQPFIRKLHALRPVFATPRFRVYRMTRDGMDATAC